MKLTSSVSALNVLSENELESVIETAFNILEKTGFVIEHIPGIRKTV